MRVATCFLFLFVSSNSINCLSMDKRQEEKATMRRQSALQSIETFRGKRLNQNEVQDAIQSLINLCVPKEDKDLN